MHRLQQRPSSKGTTSGHGPTLCLRYEIVVSGVCIMVYLRRKKAVGSKVIWPGESAFVNGIGPSFIFRGSLMVIAVFTVFPLDFGSVFPAFFDVSLLPSESGFELWDPWLFPRAGVGQYLFICHL